VLSVLPLFCAKMPYTTMFVLADVELSGSKIDAALRDINRVSICVRIEDAAKDYSAVELNPIKAVAPIARGLVIDDVDERRPPWNDPDMDPPI
jgi:hypothetical protein